MSTSFIFQPHVHEREAVVTPDVLIDELCVAVVSGARIEIVPVPIDRLTMDNGFQVAASGTTADAAVVLVGAGSGTLIGIASDHRKADDPTGRLACAKPVCREVWRLADVVGHVERLVMRATAMAGDRTTTLQEGALGDWLPIDTVIAAVARGPEIPSGLAVLCTGLVPTDPSGASEFEIAIEDPVLDRRIAHRYGCHMLADPRTADPI